MNDMRGRDTMSASDVRPWRALASYGPLVLLLGVVIALALWSHSGEPRFVGAAILIGAIALLSLAPRIAATGRVTVDKV